MDPLAEPRRIAFAGDWHGNVRWAVAAVEHAARQGVGALVHVGDFGYDFRATFVRDLDHALRRAGIPLLFVDGNHEDFDLLLRYPVRGNGLREVSEAIWHVPRGFRWTWAGLAWLGCGGAHSVDRQWREPGTSWWKQETIDEADVERCVTAPADVLICHDCPAGVDIPGLGEGGTWPAEEIVLANAHRAVLRRIVDVTQARLIVHGHYHRDYQAEVDLGYGRLFVRGLGMDGTDFDENLWIVDLADLKALVG